MAAAALLRSVARKLTRAPLTLTPTPTPRPLLAGRGLHVGARSSGGAGGSLPPPPPATSNQSGARMAVGTGTAAATGLRQPGAVLPSLATKVIEHGHRRITVSYSSADYIPIPPRAMAPPTTSAVDKDKIIQELRRKLFIACAMLSGITMYAYFGLLPATEKARAMLRAIELRPRDAPASVYLALLMQIETAARHEKRQQQKRADREEFLKFSYKILEETADTEDLKEFRAGVAKTVQLLESNDSKQNEGC